MFRIILSYLILTSFSVLFLNSQGKVFAMNTGEVNVGSNYVVFDLGDYPTAGYPDGWFGLNGKTPIKPVIGRFNESPVAVRQQLERMANSGQKSVTLVLWYADLAGVRDADGIQDGVYGHVVDSSQYNLRSQHQQNLSQVFTILKNYNFEEVFFRFSGQGINHPSYWTNTDWNIVDPNTGMSQETIYQQSWNFIHNVKNFIDSKKGSIIVKYDLGVELGGISTNQTPEFVKRLYGNFCYVHNCSETYGFSIAWDINAINGNSSRFKEYVDLIRSVSIEPHSIALDYYADNNNLLETFRDHLREKNLAEIPVIFQETFHNDRETMNKVYEFKHNNDINVTHLFQWPMERSSQQAHFSTLSYETIFHYLGSSYQGNINLSGTQRKLRIKGVMFPPEFEVVFYAGDWRHGNTPITSTTAAGPNSAKWINVDIPNEVYDNYSSVNILIKNTDPDTAFTQGWSDPRYVPIK